MPRYDDDDFLVSDSGGAPVSPLLMPVPTPAPGIGLNPDAEFMGPVQISDAAPPRPPLSRNQRQADVRKEAYANMSGTERFFTGMGEVGAALTGRASPLDKNIEQNRQKKIVQMQEVKLFAGLTKDVLDNADRLTGSARTQYINMKADEVEAISPGAGAMLTTFAEDPEYGKLVMKNAEKSPTLKTALETGGLKAARDLMKTEKGAERIRAEIESAAFPAIRQKLTGLGLAAKELLTPEEYKQMMDDGFISPAEAVRINEKAKGHAKYKALALADEEMSLASKNEEATFGMSGYATSKTAQEVLKERGKLDARDKAPTTRTVTQGTTEIQQEWKDGKWTEVGRGPKFKPGDGDDRRDRRDDRTTELKLADDYARDTKGFKEIKGQFSTATDYVSKVTADPKKSTSAGDRSLMFAYAKMNDPGDKVAVRDLQDIDKLAGVPSRIIQAAKSLAIGKELPKEIRNEMYQEIRRKFNELNSLQHGTETEYRSRAERYKLDHRNIVQPHSVNMRKDEKKPGKKDYSSMSDEELTAALGSPGG